MFFLLSSTPLAYALLPGLGAGPTEKGVRPHLADAAVSYIDQGLNPSQRQGLHFTSQGSELIPYYWFLNLVEPDGQTRLKDDLKQFGVLYDSTTPDPGHVNPDGLPIGFVRQKSDQTVGVIAEKQWMGFTCAACHTGAVIPKSNAGAPNAKMFIIDGAPSSFDAASFLAKLVESVVATDSDPTRLHALAAKVVADKHGTSVQEIENNFHAYTRDLQKLAPLYIPAESAGPGRLDCFGAIFNRVSVYDVKNGQAPPADLGAPVSFPFVWYTDRQDKIQWFGEVSNGSWLDRLARNSGEVCGVFAHVDVIPRKGLLESLKGYPSSLNGLGLGRLDTYVSSLKPPRWSDVFPAPATAAVLRGKDIFKATCQTSRCHEDVAAAGKVSTVVWTPLVEDARPNPNHLPNLDTDESTTKMVHQSPTGSGVLNGYPTFLLFGSPLQATVQAPELLDNVVAGALIGEKNAAFDAYFEHLIHGVVAGKANGSRPTPQDRAKVKAQIMATLTRKALSSHQSVSVPGPANAKAPNTFDPKFDGYESRSLNGIWATAPYLHNGSVPNLVQLLWPEKRAAKFYVGSRVYDPEVCGFVSDGSSGGVLFDTSKPGNSNKGHTYGSWLSPAQKSDLLAYLKQL